MTCQEHGKGKLLCKDGEEFEGDFKFGVRHGVGIIKQPNGKVVEGEWKNGRRVI
jgi:hypothetical protein